MFCFYLFWITIGKAHGAVFCDWFFVGQDVSGGGVYGICPGFVAFGGSSFFMQWHSGRKQWIAGFGRRAGRWMHFSLAGALDLSVHIGVLRSLCHVGVLRVEEKKRNSMNGMQWTPKAFLYELKILLYNNSWRPTHRSSAGTTCPACSTSVCHSRRIRFIMVSCRVWLASTLCA